jgi:hypothetical protein
MATETSGSNGFLYFIVGILLVAVVVLGVMFFNGGFETRSPTERAIDRTADAIGDAADKVGDAAKEPAPGG